MPASAVRRIEPQSLSRNPENPRVIFRADDLQALEDSIRTQGILVPLTVYEDRTKLTILDGERRWRCALKLNLRSIPVIVQPKPERLQNIMMMFAIHHARVDWDPLPTAYKLRDLEEEFAKQNKRSPTEAELAQLASITRGQVRRFKLLLDLPSEFQQELMQELQKPKHQQVLSVDHVLEAVRGADALARRSIITPKEENELRRAIITKFRTGIISNTTDPRMLARIGRAVDRDEISIPIAQSVARRLTRDPSYTIGEAFRDSAAQVDFEHATEQLVERLAERLQEHIDRGYSLGDELRTTLQELRLTITRLLRP